MDADQNAICLFLKTWPGQFVSRREICRRAGGKWRFREDENWAVPCLLRMQEVGIVEADDSGHFRIKQQASAGPATKRKLWVSPAIKSMLKQSGRDFGLFDLDKEVGTAELVASPGPLLT